MFRKAVGRRALPIFRKGVMASSRLSKGLGGASRSLATGAAAGQALSNTISSIPFAKEALIRSPEGRDLLNRLNTGTELAFAGSKFLGEASGLVNPLNYNKIITKTGGVDVPALGRNIYQGLERAKQLRASTEPLMKFVK